MYDRLHQKLHGYHLTDERTRRYQRIVPQLGRYASAVLGLDLAIQEGTLRFFHGMAELPGTGDLIGRLNRMVAYLEERSGVAQAQAEAAQGAPASTSPHSDGRGARGARFPGSTAPERARGLASFQSFLTLSRPAEP